MYQHTVYEQTVFVAEFISKRSPFSAVQAENISKELAAIVLNLNPWVLGRSIYCRLLYFGMKFLKHSKFENKYVIIRKYI
jgi:hypothetical protein